MASTPNAFGTHANSDLAFTPNAIGAHAKTIPDINTNVSQIYKQQTPQPKEQPANPKYSSKTKVVVVSEHETPQSYPT